MSFGRFERSKSAEPISEINVTPLVDVMMVLLVIFIITAPLLASSVRLDLPQTDAAKPSETPKFISLAIDASARVFLDDQAIDVPALAARFKQAAEQSKDTELQLRCDEAVPYGKVIEIIGLAQTAGLTRIGFVAKAESAKDPITPVKH